MNDAILFKNINKSLSGKKILDNVNIKVRKGEIYALLGANGAGKTSLIKMIYNILVPDSGEVIILGEKIKKSANKVYKKIGAIIEVPVFYERMSAFRNLEIYCDYMDISDRRCIVDIFEKIGLKGCEKTPVNNYSLGMKQRLALGRALLTKPEILVLDEPINGLDPIGINQFREFVLNINKQYGTTIFISCHILDEVAKMADKVGIMHKGIMLSEKYIQEIINESGSLEEYYMSLVNGRA
ncbi:MAG: ATP-binding cassette domain-containing protein [Lachnospiraceae bacterium]|nr:ATP-binding cassette domain-containing protein [Lachnospiraceae bacterium]